MTTRRVTPYGDTALLVDLPDTAAVAGLDAALRATRLPGVVDIVPAERTLLVVVDPRVLTQSAATAWVAGVASGAGAPEAEDLVEIPVIYDGEDLPEVAELTGLTRAEVIAAHTGTDWRVAFTGFAAGFGYLVGGDPRLRVPRRATPRVRVPAGAVALAGGYSGVYPRASPGGWQLIGHTSLAVWDVERDPPAMLRPGVAVRFVASPADSSAQ